MKKLGTLLMLAAAAGSAALAAPAYTECPAVGAATGCNVLIAINSDGSATVTLDSSQKTYNFDDTLVGVLNNSSSAITSMPLSAPRIFSLDGNGMCSAGFGVAGNCSQGLHQGDPYDYTGDLVTFSTTPADVNDGTVNFVGGLAPGMSAYFSLEGFPSSSISAGPPANGPSPVSGAPEPGTYGLLCASGLLLFGLARLRRRTYSRA